MSQFAVNLNTALMRFNNRLRQGQAQTDSLRILRKAAAVKALEDSIPRFLKSKGKSVDKAQIILQQQYFTHADTPFPVLDEDISHSIIPET